MPTIIPYALAAAMVLSGPSSAGAQQPVSRLDLSGAVSALPPPADTGKPAVVPPGARDVQEPAGCAPMLPCGTRLRGEIRKDGAVELQVPALHW